MKEISRKEQIIIDTEYFILVENQKLKRINNFTFEFDVYEQCKEIENRYCVYFKNMDEAIDVISNFNQYDYKMNIDKDSIRVKLSGIMYHANLNSEKDFWISFFVK
ncbi:hypothetical protein [Pontimicrobium sp. IMCC45349]|uniref:hypothetical protein n=1 Tax=Pontimicrobium sp. IMCC45349 TaxID=3391574 RepID=UPI0039A03B97